MSINVIDHLHKTRAEQSLPVSVRAQVTPKELLTSVESILSAANGEDNAFLNNRGFFTSQQTAKYAKAVAELQQHLALDKWEHPYQKEELREICGQFGFKFLPVRFYNGELPSNIVQSIREFEKNYNPSYSSAFNKPQIDYFILAPAKYFKLEKRPRAVTSDPILFAHARPKNENPNDQHKRQGYYIVAQWGNLHVSRLRRAVYSTLIHHLTAVRWVASILWTVTNIILLLTIDSQNNALFFWSAVIGNFPVQLLVSLFERFRDNYYVDFNEAVR